MTNDELAKLLKAIEAMALVPYPFPEDDRAYDVALTFALGQIAGLANKAVADFRAGRVG